MSSIDNDEEYFDTVQIPIDGALDLHMFAPKDATSVVDEYIRECLKSGIYEIRIIHAFTQSSQLVFQFPDVASGYALKWC